jgi:hypothetical protein
MDAFHTITTRLFVTWGVGALATRFPSYGHHAVSDTVNRMTTNSQPTNDIPQPVISRQLPDGSLVELLYSEDDHRTRLAVGLDADVRIEDAIDGEGGQRMLPLSASNNLIHHAAVLLPSGVESFDSPAALAAEVGAYLDRYLDLSPNFRTVATWYILLTWVYDAFNELPYLRFRGDFGTGKTRALSVIGSLCFKPFFASGASTVSPIFHILDRFRGTLVLDEADFRFSDEKSELNNGNVRGFPVLRNSMNAKREFDPRAFHVYGPKLVAMRQAFDDEALESRCLTEEMGQREVRKDIPINLPDAQKTEATSLRNKLLSYRFRYQRKVAIDPRLVDASQSARINQLLVPLLSIIEDEEARTRVRTFASGIDEELRFDRSLKPEALVLRAIHELGKGDSRQSVAVSDITKLVIARHSKDFDRFVTPRYVGEIIRKRLRLATEKRHGVYVVSLAEGEHFAHLCKRYGIEEPRL